MSTPTPPGPPGEGQPGPSGPPPGWQPPAQNQPPVYGGQPGYGQQPGPGQPPYGQQPGAGQPPYGQQPGAGQPGQQWTGYDPNRYRPQDAPQDQTRVFDPNGPGGFAGPPGYQRPPRTNRAALFIVLLVVLLVGVLGVGGVVAYNLVGDNSSGGTSPGGLDPSDIPTDIPSEYPSYLPSEDPSQEPSADPTTSKPTTGTGDPAVAKALAQRFVTQLNANKPAAAAALACPEAKEVMPTLIRVLIKPPTKLTVGDTLGSSLIIVRISGTTNGRSVSGMVVIQESEGASPCVRLVQVAPN